MKNPHTIHAQGKNFADIVVIDEDADLFVAGHCDVALVEVLGDKTLRIRMMSKAEYDELEKAKEAERAMRNAIANRAAPAFA